MESEKKNFSCVLCDNKLPSKEALQEHFRKHANKEIDSKGRAILKTDLINKDATSVSRISLNNKEAIQCELCSMNFTTVTQAIQHKFRKHPESSSKYYCPFCGMQFPLKFTRDKHVNNHQGMSTVGSFPCSECGVKFHNAGAQQYHVRSTHKRVISMFKPVPTPPPSKKIKINNANEAQSVYYCYLCGTEYIIKFNLQKHLERAHTEEERNTVPADLIKCTTCDALFYNKKAYETHNIYHKPDDLYVTSEEQRLQTVTRVDQDFDIRRVQLTADKFIPVDKPKQIRRKQISNPTGVSKQEKVIYIDLDEELSPTSSIDSSDSETETDKTKNNTNNDNVKSVSINSNDIKTKINKEISLIFNKINKEDINNKKSTISDKNLKFDIKNKVITEYIYPETNLALIKDETIEKTIKITNINEGITNTVNNSEITKKNISQENAQTEINKNGTLKKKNTQFDNEIKKENKKIEEILPNTEEKNLEIQDNLLKESKNKGKKRKCNEKQIKVVGRTLRSKKQKIENDNTSEKEEKINTKEIKNENIKTPTKVQKNKNIKSPKIIIKKKETPKKSPAKSKNINKKDDKEIKINITQKETKKTKVKNKNTQISKSKQIYEPVRATRSRTKIEEQKEDTQKKQISKKNVKKKY